MKFITKLADSRGSGTYETRIDFSDEIKSATDTVTAVNDFIDDQAPGIVIGFILALALAVL